MVIRAVKTEQYVFLEYKTRNQIRVSRVRRTELHNLSPEDISQKIRDIFHIEKEEPIEIIYEK